MLLRISSNWKLHMSQKYSRWAWVTGDAHAVLVLAGHEHASCSQSGCQQYLRLCMVLHRGCFRTPCCSYHARVQAFECALCALMLMTKPALRQYS